ncbi:hypothetical protein EKL30_13325 [Candidimonas sp. SYP-B2681]|uniref:hypothetical protein n=1 Tax=Candidimonas sp. SYP-B2681 TaxID=2497686 RepID=UPI000F85BD51|nr:hypothetical protein [Candidimonas sp. SYP-B2681]RTZ41549.1 hypothetical protein EKL30_13325 [Candidimonas sp. SYP-B2681]
MKTLVVAILLALLAALLITGLYKPKPLEAQLLNLQVAQTMPEMADELTGETAEIQALFLSYTDDPVLLAKARLALLRYPDLARPIFLTYGEHQNFREVLRTYGEDITLPIHYFTTHEVLTLEVMRGVSETSQSALNAIRGLWNDKEPGQAVANGALSSEERGNYAIQFIKADGYDFLGQFVISPKGEVGWVQTERVLEGINSFFAGGVRGLESKFRRDETIAVSDVGWAALDVAIGVSALKVLRMGKGAAAGGRSLSFSERSAALGAGLWRGSAIGARVVKYGAPAVLAYIAIRHPSVINSFFGYTAEKLGLPVGLVQVVGWTLVLTPIMLLLRFILGPLGWTLAAMGRMFRWSDRMLRRRSAARMSAY